MEISPLTSQNNPLGYQASFIDVFFVDNSIQLKTIVSSAVTNINPIVMVEITYTDKTKTVRQFTISGKEYDHILYSITTAPHHLSLLADGYAASELFINISTGFAFSIKKKGAAFGLKDVIYFEFPGLPIEKELSQSLINSANQARVKFSHIIQTFTIKMQNHIDKLPQ